MADSGPTRGAEEDDEFDFDFTKADSAPWNDNWHESGDEEWVGPVDHERGAADGDPYDDIVVDPNQQGDYIKQPASSPGASVSPVLEEWDNSLRSLWFTTMITNKKEDEEKMAMLIALALQFFSGFALQANDFANKMDGAKKMDIINLNDEDWSFSGYYIHEKAYCEYTLNYFLSATKKGSAAKHVGVNLRTNSGERSCTNELVDHFYNFLEKEHLVEELGGEFSDPDDYSDSTSSEYPGDSKGVEFAKSPQKLEECLSSISKKRATRHKLLGLASAVRNNDVNKAFLNVRDASFEVSRLISGLLRNMKARPSSHMAAMMALEELHFKITDKITLENVVQCFFQMWPETGFENAETLDSKKNPLGDTGFEKAKDFRDDSCQNLKVDLLKLINDSAVVEGIDKEWTDGKKEFDLYEMINEKIAELQEIDQEIQPEYMTIDALKSIVDAVLPSDVKKWDAGAFIVFAGAYFLEDESVVEAVRNNCEDKESCFEIIMGLQEDVTELQDLLKKRVGEMKKEANNAAMKKIAWEDLEEGKPYTVRKSKVPAGVEPWLAGMRLKLKSKSDGDKTVEAELRNKTVVSLPYDALCKPEAHNNPQSLEISVLTANPTMVEHTVFSPRPDLSEFYNAMQSSFQEMVEKSPYEVKFFHGALTSKNITNERVHVLQLQGISPLDDEEREEGIIVEDEADSGVVVDADELQKQNYKLYSCKLLVLAQTYSRSVLTDFHQHKKVPHVLALGRNQSLDAQAAAFLKVFYDGLQQECLTIQKAYDKASAELSATPFELFPKEPGYHEKRLIDLIYSGIADKPEGNGFTLTHSCIPNNVEGRPASMFGDKVPAQMQGPIAGNFVHQICDNATRDQVTIAECPASPVCVDDGDVELFEYTVENLKDNVVYRLFRSQWNENQKDTEHRYVHGIVTVKVKEGSSGADMLRTTFAAVREVFGWKNGKDDPEKIRKKLVKKLKKKRMCLVFEIPSLGEDLEVFFKTIGDLKKASDSIRFIFLVETDEEDDEMDALSDFEKFFGDSDNIQFDLEDEDLVQECMFANQ